MKKITVIPTGNLNINESYVAEPIEIKIEKMIAQEEPIVASMGYVGTERKDGVQAQYDIRTNRFEIAHEVMSKAATSHDKGRDYRREESKKSSLGEDITATPEITE